MLATLPQVWRAASTATFPPTTAYSSQCPEPQAKKLYMQALRLVHPDKLPPGIDVRQEVKAKHIHAALQSAYEEFKRRVLVLAGEHPDFAHLQCYSADRFLFAAHNLAAAVAQARARTWPGHPYP